MRRNNARSTKLPQGFSATAFFLREINNEAHTLATKSPYNPHSSDTTTAPSGAVVVEHAHRRLSVDAMRRLRIKPMHGGWLKAGRHGLTGGDLGTGRTTNDHTLTTATRMHQQLRTERFDQVNFQRQ